MTAGRGIIHSEMPVGEGTSNGLQLWINLSSKDKMLELFFPLAMTYYFQINKLWIAHYMFISRTSMLLHVSLHLGATLKGLPCNYLVCVGRETTCTHGNSQVLKEL